MSRRGRKPDTDSEKVLSARQKALQKAKELRDKQVSDLSKKYGKQKGWQ